MKLTAIQGQYVYLVARYTGIRDEAACGFSLHTTYLKDLNANDMEAAMRMIEGAARSMGVAVRE